MCENSIEPVFLPLHKEETHYKLTARLGTNGPAVTHCERPTRHGTCEQFCGEFYSVFPDVMVNLSEEVPAEVAAYCAEKEEEDKLMPRERMFLVHKYLKRGMIIVNFIIRFSNY